MQKGKRVRPSPAMVVALIALVAALAGTSFAAVKIGKGAVTAKSIKSNAVTEKKIKAGAVTETKIADGAVSNAKIAGSGKTRWVRVNISGTAIEAQSGGVSVDFIGVGDGDYIVDFGVNLADRGVSATGGITLGLIGAMVQRCNSASAPVCPAPYDGSATAVMVITYVDGGGVLDTGFEAVASP